MSGVTGCWQLVKVDDPSNRMGTGKGYYVTNCNAPTVRGPDGSYSYCQDHQKAGYATIEDLRASCFPAPDDATAEKIDRALQAWIDEGRRAVTRLVAEHAAQRMTGGRR